MRFGSQFSSSHFCRFERTFRVRSALHLASGVGDRLVPSAAACFNAACDTGNGCNDAAPPSDQETIPATRRRRVIVNCDCKVRLKQGRTAAIEEVPVNVRHCAEALRDC